MTGKTAVAAIAAGIAAIVAIGEVVPKLRFIPKITKALGLAKPAVNSTKVLRKAASNRIMMRLEQYGKQHASLKGASPLTVLKHYNEANRIKSAVREINGKAKFLKLEPHGAVVVGGLSADDDLRVVKAIVKAKDERKLFGRIPRNRARDLKPIIRRCEVAICPVTAGPPEISGSCTSVSATLKGDGSATFGFEAEGGKVTVSYDTEGIKSAATRDPPACVSEGHSVRLDADPTREFSATCGWCAIGFASLNALRE